MAIKAVECTCCASGPENRHIKSFVCDSCHRDLSTSPNPQWNYCPYCGESFMFTRTEALRQAGFSDLHTRGVSDEPKCDCGYCKTADTIRALRAQLAGVTGMMDRNLQADVDAAKSYPGIHGESFSATEALHWYEEKLAAITAERDGLIVHGANLTERAEKAAAERDAHNAARIRQIRTQQEWAEQRDEWLCEVLIRHGIDSYGTDKKPIRQMFKEHPEDQVISGVLSVLIRARDTHWAECEAARLILAGKGRLDDYRKAREASDRARNPILEPPTQGGENPGAV